MLKNIVRVDLTDQITNIKPYNIKIIYGSEDNMVNPQKVIDYVPKEYKKRIFVIPGGGHDIANTHAKEIINIIKR
jgi:pimeloyl-ACP methyl ester carboxylesterase